MAACPSRRRRPWGSWGDSRFSRASLRPYAIFFGTVLKLAQAKFFHQGRNIDAKAPAQYPLQTVPATNRVALRAPPPLDAAVLGRFLFVSAAKFDPVSRSFEHGVKVINAARGIVQNRAADGTDQNLLAVFLLKVHRVLGRTGRRSQLPRIVLSAILLDGHGMPFGRMGGETFVA